MSLIDRWPATPMKQFTGWAAFVAFFLFSLAAMWWNRSVPMELWYGLAGLVTFYNGDGTLQFFAKRKTHMPADQQSLTVTSTGLPATAKVEAKLTGPVQVTADERTEPLRRDSERGA